jgi:hypothetical protein
MENQELSQLLEKLHHALESAGQVDEKGLSLLKELDADIHRALARGEPSSHLSDRLEQAITHFEVEHPTLTSILSQMLASLSNAGI